MKEDRKGSGEIIFMVIVVLVVLAAGVWYFAEGRKQSALSPSTPQPVISSAATTTPVSPSPETPTSSTEMSFQAIGLNSAWQLNSSYNYSQYRGIFYTQAELENIWKYMANAYGSGAAAQSQGGEPVIPQIDFSKYSVIWYAVRGSNASAVTINKVLETANTIEVYATLLYSDYGSNGLGLWTIPKTDKPVQFMETTESDGNAVP